MEALGSIDLERLNGQQRSYLSKQAQELNPIVYIGKNGLREGVIASLDKALADHELVKVRFIDFKDNRNEISHALEEATDSVLVRVIGNVGIFFRPARKPEKRVYILPD